MSRLGVAGRIKKVTDMLSPHLDTATSTLASFLIREDAGQGPEENLADFLKWRAWRRKMGFSDEAIEEEVLEILGDEYEGPAVRRDADNASRGFGSGGDSRHPDNGFGKRDRPGNTESDRTDKLHRF